MRRASARSPVLDTISAFNGEYTPAENGAGAGCGLYAPDASTHVLLASRPSAETSGALPFTSLLELVLDWQSVKSEPLGAEGLFTAMRAEESMFSELPAVEYFRGATPFELLRAPGGSPSSRRAAAPAPASLVRRRFPTRDSRATRCRARANGQRPRTGERSDDRRRSRRPRSSIYAPQHARRRATRAVYHALLQSFRNVRRPDGSFNAASVLDLLGAADIDESLLASAHRPEGLLAHKGLEGNGLAAKALLPRS
jgi:hypothetical protein